MRSLPLAAVVSLACLASAIPARASNADCFCVKNDSSSGVKKYQVIRYRKPACADVQYKSNGKAPWDNGVPPCSSSIKVRSTPASSPAAADELMRRCFCTKRVNGDGLKQYKVVSYPTVPECKGATYKQKGQGPWENTNNCDRAEVCKKNSDRCKKDLDDATKKLSDKDPLKAMRAQNEVVNITKRCQEIEESCYTNPPK